MRRGLKMSTVALLILVGTFMLGSGTLIQLKALIAQTMLDSAWDNTVKKHKQYQQSDWKPDSRSRPWDEPIKPWPWADTWPVAKLKLGTADEMVVMEGASGQALAFGPGRMNESSEGLMLIAGHRDTHFRELKELVVGDEVSVQALNGDWRVYHVSDIAVVDSNIHGIDLNPQEGPLGQLMLVTCYPFDTLEVGGTLRYVVTAKEPV